MVSGELVTQRICTSCRNVVATSISAPDNERIDEDELYPEYRTSEQPRFDSFTGFRPIGWTLVVTALLFALVTYLIVKDFS